METNVSSGMPSDREIAKVATGSIIGSIIEQYDFLVTGTIAGLVWGTLFFGPYGGIVGAISTYALGIMVRPIGATVFGQLADRIGRRDSMVYAIILMGISTLIIGLVPVGTGIIDAIAVGVILLMRVLQGISFCAEFGTASTWVAEYAAKSKRRAFWSGWVAFAVPFGLLLALGFVLVLENSQGLAFFESGSYTAGWRILFYVGFIVAIVGLIIRLRLDDSVIFEKLRGSKKTLKYPALTVWKELPKKVLVTSLINGAFGAGFFLAFVFGNEYMTKIGYSAIHADEVLLISAAFMFFFMLFGSFIADRVGRKLPIMISLTLLLIFAVPFFVLLNTLNFWLAVLAFVVTWSVGYGLAYGALPAIYTEFFPTKYRASGASASYQFSQVYGGGFAPILATVIFAAVGTTAAYPYIAGITVVYTTMAVLAMFVLQETKNVDLETMTTTDRLTGSN